MTLEELQKRELEQAKALEETKKAIARAQEAEAGKHHAATLATVETYAQHWTPEQKRAFHDHLGLSKPAKKAATKKASGGKPKSKAPAPPFYQLDTGETCSEKAGKFKKEWANALNKAIAKAGGKRESLPRYPNPNAPIAAANSARK